MSERPRFAVVGHPNKGKSSIVSTLAGDDSIEIKADPRTTSAVSMGPMRHTSPDGDVTSRRTGRAGNSKPWAL